jgi:hypothetical protein
MSSAISKSSREDASPLFAIAFILSNSWRICAGVDVLLEIASPDDPRAAWPFLNIAAFARATTLFMYVTKWVCAPLSYSYCNLGYLVAVAVT